MFVSINKHETGNSVTLLYPRASLLIIQFGSVANSFTRLYPRITGIHWLNPALHLPNLPWFCLVIPDLKISVDGCVSDGFDSILLVLVCRLSVVSV